MGRLAVEDDHPPRLPAVERVETGLDLWISCRPEMVPSGDERLGLGDGQLGDESLVLVEYAGHIGQEQEARRLLRTGDGAGEGTRH